MGGTAPVVAWTAGAGAGLAVVLAVAGALRRRLLVVRDHLAEHHHLARACSGPAAASASWWLAVALMALVLGSCAAQLHLRSAGLLGTLADEGAVLEVVGVVRSEVRPQPGRWGTGDAATFRTVLAVEEVAGRGKEGTAAAPVAVLGGPEWRGLAYGTRVLATGRLAAAAGAGRPPVLTSSDVQVLSAPGPADRGVHLLRTGLLAATEDLPPDARGLVPGAAFGDTSRVPVDLEQAMKDAGLTHITAVSGGHFAVLSVTVLAGTALLRLPRPVRAVTTAVVLGAFVLLVHPEPSVVRAAGMGVVSLLALLLGRPGQAVAGLAATVVVLVALDPWLTRSLGFLLSVVATGAILLLAPPLAALLDGVVPRGPALVLAVPVAAQAVCAPVLLLVEPAVSAYAVPANVLAAPAVGPATLLGLGATLTASWCEPVSDVLVQGAAGAAWWIAWVARTVAGLPGARVPWPGGPGGAALLAVLTAVVLVALLRRPAATDPADRPTHVAG